MKRHPYFNNTPWGDLVTQQAPFTPDSSKFPSTDNMRDGATDEWDLEGDPTPIDDTHHHYTDSKNQMLRNTSKQQKQQSGGSGSGGGGNRGSDSESEGFTMLSKGNKHMSADFDVDRSAEKWKRFLYENEKQVFNGTIYKRKVQHLLGHSMFIIISTD